LVLIANPVPMGVKKDDSGNGRTVLWRWWCVGVLFVFGFMVGLNLCLGFIFVWV
jgi:hypothetical protein